MYHRFNESKYPSTNIQLDVFKEQLKIIENEGIQFINPKNFKENLSKNKKKRKILLTIDDGLLSFYQNAWPILKQNKIPFILFVNTREVGAFNYMNWDQILELHKFDHVEIGNHSHSHEYLADESGEKIKKDILKSIKIFKEKLGKNSNFFSYPFGEYSLEQKKYINNKFKYAFGQHSGVIDTNKDKYELPRFPINEKYGDLERFEFLIKLMPLQYKKIIPEDKLLTPKNNPPKVSIEFFKEQKNLNNINCFSNEGNEWGNPKLELIDNKLNIIFRDKFLFRRGRVNCSLNDNNQWRWFGIQFVLKKNQMSFFNFLLVGNSLASSKSVNEFC